MAVICEQMAVITKVSGRKVQELVKGVKCPQMEDITQADSSKAN